MVEDNDVELVIDDNGSVVDDLINHSESVPVVENASDEGSTSDSSKPALKEADCECAFCRATRDSSIDEKPLPKLKSVKELLDEIFASFKTGFPEVKSPSESPAREQTPKPETNRPVTAPYTANASASVVWLAPSAGNIVFPSSAVDKVAFYTKD